MAAISNSSRVKSKIWLFSRSLSSLTDIELGTIAAKAAIEKAGLTPDQVEELTGYDFFAELPDEMEIRIEAQNKLSAWR